MTRTKELLHALVASRLPYFELGITGRDVLQRFLSIDVTNSALARIIARNQYYKDSLERYVTAQLGGRSLSEMAQNVDNDSDFAIEGEGEEIPDSKEVDLYKKEASLSYAILLVGMLGTRDFVVAWRMRRRLGLPEPDLNVEDKQKLYKPKDDLAYAIKTQEFCKDKEIPYPESAGYAAGLVFDWFNLYVTSWSDKNKALEKFVDDCWKRSIKRGYLVFKIASNVKDFPYSKFAFASGMILDVGKLILAAHFRKNSNGSEWIDFEKVLERHPSKYKIPIDRLEEEIGNPFTHEEVMDFFISYFPIFDPVRKAIRHYREPYLLENSSKDSYHLASALSAATWVIATKKVPDPKSEDWALFFNKKWFKDLGISEEKFSECARQAIEVSA